MAETVEERIKRLEDIAFEGDGLTRAVTRLGLNASALGEALLTVDRQQQTLTRLGQELNEVKETTPSKDDVNNVATDSRRAGRQLVFLIVLPIALVLAALTFGISEAAHDACEKRQASTRAVIATFSKLSPSTETNRAALDKGVLELRRTLTESCDSQYKLHL